ncbi:hypothetical protein CLOP_g22733 [Closterium sp. NIES-67]|nr:hypothetical protein CLOP_g22733 [Closterium sp. NIES-67]
MLKNGLYEMLLNEKGMTAEKVTYQQPTEEGVLAREELRASLKSVPVEELRKEAVSMVAAAAKVDMETLHRSFLDWMVEAERQSGKQLKVLRTDNGGEFVNEEFNSYLHVIFYENVTYLKWKGVSSEIATAGEAANLEKVEGLLEETSIEGIGDEVEEIGEEAAHTWVIAARNYFLVQLDIKNAFLHGHQDEGLLFEGGEETLELVGYADASHASCKETRRGAYGYVEQLEKQQFKFEFVRTEEQAADFLTKVLPRANFENCKEKVGIRTLKDMQRIVKVT